MRAVIWVLLLAGCVDTIGHPDIGITEPGIVPGAALCVRAEPNAVTFDGTVAVEQRAPTVVTLVSKDDCMEPGAMVERAELDDPRGAFAFAPTELFGEVFPDQPLEVDVNLIATEPGVYEGQLLVHAIGTFGEGEIAVQLYAEIPAQ